MDQIPQLDWLFAVPLFQQKLPGFAEHQGALLDVLQDLKRQDAGVRRSNVGGWHSADLQTYGSLGEIGWLMKQIRGFAAACISQLSASGATFEIVFDEVWAIINQEGDWNTPHTHMPSQWSGVCHLQVNDDPTVEHSGNLLFIDPVPLGPQFRRPINTFVKPKTGGIFLFPSYITHMVEPHHGEADRVVVAFNLQLRSLV
ncbi:MAG: TIGR02466 family protein [Gammaproteobacteria bacterium]|jgi:uncharacterized protein (TIGR02466 family)|nr:TIGR02466 family protein [Gammaproteobacteria bacterium]